VKIVRNNLIHLTEARATFGCARRTRRNIPCLRVSCPMDSRCP